MSLSLDWMCGFVFGIAGSIVASTIAVALARRQSRRLLESILRPGLNTESADIRGGLRSEFSSETHPENAPPAVVSATDANQA